MTKIVHCVLFWFGEGVDLARREAFEAGLRGLTASPWVDAVRIGRPAKQTPGKERAVVDDSYDYQLLIEFADQAAADAYQDPSDAVHTAFIERFKGDWARVRVYDSVEVG